MFRSRLRDAALAAAKSYSHEKVEPRHILFAAVRYLVHLPEVRDLLPAAKAALEPRGVACGVPELTAEAAALLDQFVSEGEAVARLRAALKPDQTPATHGSTNAQSETDSQEAPRLAAASGDASPDPAESLAAVLAELDGLIGLASVKRQVKNVVAVVQANQARTKAGLPPVTSTLHLVFTGPPGTGKTTVARLVARLYACVGALPGDNFTEASRSDLVAGYVGQTALKTADIVERTRPGVLFIDEAYSLAPTHPSDFGAEAVAALVKAMEDHRGDLAVIAAGYAEEMSGFVTCNPGLKSRFKTYIDFPDYTPEELTLIFEIFAKDSAIGLAAGVREKALEIFRRACGRQDFGNARYARSVFEDAYARMAARAAEDGTVQFEELNEIAIEDVDWQEGALRDDVRRIGFRRGRGSAGELTGQ